MGLRPLLQTILFFRSCIVKKNSSYFNSQTFEASLQTATPNSRRMRAGVAQGGIISLLLFMLYVNAIPSPSRYV
jgi:hypothetical protein